MFLGRALDRPGVDLAANAVTRPDHWLLADRPAPGVELAAGMLVALLTADVDLVHLDRVGEQAARPGKAALS